MLMVEWKCSIKVYIARYDSGALAIQSIDCFRKAVSRNSGITVACGAPLHGEADSRQTCGKAVFVLILLLALAGCGTEKTRNITVNGWLTIPGNSQMFSGARAKVSIVEQRPNGLRGPILAERSLHDLRRVPVRFTIVVPRALIESDVHYLFEARILNASDEPLWVTRSPKALRLLEQKRPLTLYLSAG